MGRVRAGADVPRAGGRLRRVREGPGREPRRDRRPGDPRVPRTRAGVRGRVLDRRRGLARRQARRRGGAHRPARRQPQLSPHPQHHRRRPEDRRRRHPSRLRLPLGGSVLRGDLRRRGHRLHRAAPRRDGEGRRQVERAAADAEGGPAASPRGRRARDHARCRARDRGRDRLPRDHQGGRGRRRARDERRPARAGSRAAVPDDARDGAGGVQGQRRLHRALPRDFAPHGDPARLRQLRERHLRRRTRLLGPAAPPEADRGGALGAPERRAAARDRRGRRSRRALDRLQRRRDDGVPARPRRQPVLHGDQRAHPGRASGERARDGDRPDQGADPGRGG